MTDRDAGSPANTAYWRKTRRVTIGLLLLWFSVTLLTSLYAVELNRISVLGFPLGFYFAAQGSLIVFLLIVAFYAWYMNRLDRITTASRQSESGSVSDSP